MWRDDALLLDILLATRDARQFVENLDWPAFQASRLHQAAVIRCLEIMGEAAARVSAPSRATHSDIPWRLMADMRNRLIHGYDEVRLDVVWAVVQQELPRLIEVLASLVPPDHDGGGAGSGRA
jgi:uncharacterized protein with HEPN domain